MAQKRTKRMMISRSLADRLSRKLEQLPEKKKTELTPKELIFEKSEQLDSALAKGYDYADLVAILKEDGIQLSKTTLRQYLSEARKRRANQDERVTDKTHRAEPTLAQSDEGQHPPDKLFTQTDRTPVENSAQRLPKKLGRSRLQSDENPTRYPDGHGQPIEMKTDL